MQSIFVFLVFTFSFALDHLRLGDTVPLERVGNTLNYHFFVFETFCFTERTTKAFEKSYDLLSDVFTRTNFDRLMPMNQS